MARQPRLDIPGLVHHVMARGIDGCDIFRCDEDRQGFLKRLADEVNKPNGPHLYAWALITNHFHLLLRPGTGLLSPMMRRLMTGHAVTFNLRHKRKGHLFQNRFKSIIVEEEPYFLELVRYIHLNPVRRDNILQEVSQQSGVNRHLILETSRRRRVSHARRQFYRRAHDEAGATLALLGRMTGRCHTSVREAIMQARIELEETALMNNLHNQPMSLHALKF